MPVFPVEFFLHLSTPFEKVSGGIFDPFFFVFTRDFSFNHKILISMERTGSGKLFCVSPNFLTQKVMILGKVKYLFFLPFFSNFSNFFENYHLKSEVLISIKNTGCGKILAFAAQPKLFNEK